MSQQMKVVIDVEPLRLLLWHVCSLADARKTVPGTGGGCGGFRERPDVGS